MHPIRGDKSTHAPLDFLLLSCADLVTFFGRAVVEFGLEFGREFGERNLDPSCQTLKGGFWDPLGPVKIQGVDGSRPSVGVYFMVMERFFVVMVRDL